MEDHRRLNNNRIEFGKAIEGTAAKIIANEIGADIFARAAFNSVWIEDYFSTENVQVVSVE